MKQKLFCIFISTFTVLSTVSAARAQGESDAQGFGEAGQVAISNDFLASLKIISPEVGDSVTMLLLQPAADFFVVDNLSLGGQALIGYQSGTRDSTAYGIAPRIGYDLAFSPNASFWPRVGVSYVGMSTDGGSDSSAIALGLEAPFLFHPAPHFFIGFGPSFAKVLSSKVGDFDAMKTTTFGLTSQVGGWF